MNKELFNHNNRTTPSLKELGETFRLRAYGRTELAQAYNPHLSPGASAEIAALIVGDNTTVIALSEIGRAHV